ncbi:MAG: polysaccharide biosynthesis C-terminal domain-containing protein [Legionellales bacterium]|nr:polysaccharide biosynthesis C-terminal domain-containing protein [Legionellales bacterium]
MHYRIQINLLLLMITSLLVKIVFNIFLARHLPSHVYGDVNLSLQLVGFAAVFILLGTDSGAKRYLAKYISRRLDYAVEGYLSWNFKLLIKLVGLFLFLALITCFITLLLNIHDPEKLEQLHIVLYLIWISPLLALVNLMGSYLLSTQNLYYSYFFKNIAIYLAYALGLGFAVYGFELLISSGLILVIFSIGLLLVIAIQFILFSMSLNSALKINYVNVLMNPPLYKPKWIKTSVQLIFNNMIYTVSATLDLLAVEIIHPSENAVGYYSAALALTAIVWKTTDVLNFFKPKISTLVAEKSWQKLQADVQISTLIMLAAGAVFGLLIIVFAQGLLGNLFGAEYTAAKSTVMLLVIGNFINTWGKPARVLLSYSDNEQAVLRILLLGLILITVSSLILTHFYGMIGAAFATILTSVFTTVGSIKILRKHIPCKTLLFI